MGKKLVISNSLANAIETTSKLALYALALPCPCASLIVGLIQLSILSWVLDDAISI